jgi:hypothetical protein
MKNLVLLLATLWFALPARARLGETQAKVTERYGKPTQVYRDVKGRTGYIYRFDGYLVMVQYIDGISHSEIYAKENDAELNEKELDSILAANASGEKWQEIPNATMTKASGPGWRGWVILRTGALSAYGPSEINDKKFQHAISVGTRAYSEQTKALDRR